MGGSLVMPAVRGVYANGGNHRQPGCRTIQGVGSEGPVQILESFQGGAVSRDPRETGGLSYLSVLFWAAFRNGNWRSCLGQRRCEDDRT